MPSAGVELSDRLVPIGATLSAGCGAVLSMLGACSSCLLMVRPCSVLCMMCAMSLRVLQGDFGGGRMLR